MEQKFRSSGCHSLKLKKNDDGGGDVGDGDDDDGGGSDGDIALELSFSKLALTKKNIISDGTTCKNIKDGGEDVEKVPLDFAELRIDGQCPAAAAEAAATAVVTAAIEKHASSQNPSFP
uniref:Uncharacterized protein n=1 Tax=Vespula pensylvanica TaxID=30213 RepID=A0A834PET3_VESPE|nr:hypothetical protein H0235_000207 [Vespula pensylvanica]